MVTPFPLPLSGPVISDKAAPPSPLSGGAWNQPGPAGGLSKATTWASDAHVFFFSDFPGAHEHWDRPQLVREREQAQLTALPCTAQFIGWQTGLDKRGSSKVPTNPPYNVLNCIIKIYEHIIYVHFAGTPSIQPRLATVK